MDCTSEQITNWKINCAKFCKKQNENPIASYMLDGAIVESNSVFFDNNLNNTKYKWDIFYKNILIYSFGYGTYGEDIIELSNSSIYNKINLGFQNQDIINLIDNLPNIIVSYGDELILSLTVQDSNGYESLNQYDKLKILKFIT